MPYTSNFQEAIREAQMSALTGPNVVKKSLPYVGGGLILTAGGVFGGLSLLQNSPAAFMPAFVVALIGQIVLFFVAQNAAAKGNNGTALPLLTTYSLLTGFTLTGLIVQAVGSVGIGGIGVAALACGITFVIAQQIGTNMSDENGLAFGRAIGLGMIALLVAMVVQLIGGFFFPGMLQGPFELLIAGAGTVIFAGAAVVDFYTMPRTYRDDQYLAAALGMYLTYINLFIFILRFLIALNGNNRD